MLKIWRVYAIMPGMTKKPAIVAPAKPYPLQVKLDEGLLLMLDELRLGRADFPNRSDIVRELIKAAHAQRSKVKR